jgi:small-conductance mechanosensitive channel
VPEYDIYMDRQQAINLAILRQFAQEKIEFAFPTRTIVGPGLDARLRRSA